MAEIIIGNLPQAAALTGSERVPMDQRVGGTIAATALTPGLGYAIISLGSTNWTACGVPAGVTPAVGLVFTCSAVGTGTGTAQQVETVDAASSEIAALAPSTNLSYDPATRLLASSTGADVTLPLVTTQAPGLVPTLAGGTGSFLRADGTWASPPAGATDLSYDPATRLLTSSTGADVTLPLVTPTTAGLLPPTNDPLSLASLTVTGTLTAPHIHGAMAGPLYIHVRNDAGVSLPAGATVHVVGNQGDTAVMLVILARADDPATMPANGILVETLAPNAEGHAIDVGELTGLNTSGLTAGAQVFVALTGGLTMTRPATNPQAIATVGRVHATTGSILVNASPVLSTVAFTGAYGDLTGRPTLATVATTGAYADLSGRPSLATVATTGAYADLTGRPNLATVATTGAYSDLTGRPPEISQADAEAGSSTTFSLWSAQRWRQAAAALLSDSAPQNHAATAAAGTGTSAARADHVHQFQPTDVVIPLSAPTGNLAVGEVENLAWPRATILTAIPVWSVKTAPVGAVLQLDIRVGGTSIFSTLPTIDATETSTTTAAVPAVFSTAFVSGGQTIAAGSLVTFHVTQIGSSTAGAGLKVALPTRRGS